MSADDVVGLVLLAPFLIGFAGIILIAIAMRIRAWRLRRKYLRDHR